MEILKCKKNMNSIDFKISLVDNKNHRLFVGCSTIERKVSLTMEHDRPLGMDINCVANRIRREVDKEVMGIYEDEASRSNGWIIRYIAAHSDQDVFQKDIEKEFSLTRSNISKVVDLMVQKGLIVRSPVEYDARLKKLTLTPKAMKLHQQLEEGHNQFEQRLTEGFSEEEIIRFREYLRRLEKNLQKEKDNNSK